MCKYWYSMGDEWIHVNLGATLGGRNREVRLNVRTMLSATFKLLLFAYYRWSCGVEGL